MSPARPPEGANSLWEGQGPRPEGAPVTAIAAAGARVWRVGADVDTDQLAPGHAMKHGIEVVARHCLEAVRPDFASGVRPGDVLVAGPNFGIGSSREQAASALVHLGLAAVVAPSFSGLYFRNAFNVGLLLLTCERAAEIADDERIAFDAAAGRIVRAGGAVLPTRPIPGFLLDMVAAGGLLAQLQQRAATRVAFGPARGIHHHEQGKPT